MELWADLAEQKRKEELKTLLEKEQKQAQEFAFDLFIFNAVDFTIEAFLFFSRIARNRHSRFGGSFTVLTPMSNGPIRQRHYGSNLAEIHTTSLDKNKEAQVRRKAVMSATATDSSSLSSQVMAIIIADLSKNEDIISLVSSSHCHSCRSPLETCCA